ncbi:hypothetical protein Lal_00029232 [Lupinus albus]|uniref:Putative transcription factor C2H2 family n=1 Tax=Lupinus albus TaxID=3870 RepID=A0A6A5NPZ1_LUPAL|nr:putative transcription factor C2H2 family [Lupinus albus]KAF1885343.1 hypothetical protein Lal_00029232 [Lupinus albus]
MAIASLHNVSVLDSSFLRESHSQSSRRRGDGRRGSTRASSLLRMWREIEDEHVARQFQGRPGEVLLEQRSDGLINDLSHVDMPHSHVSGQSHLLEEAVLAVNESEIWAQSQSQNVPHGDQEDLSNSSCENFYDLGEIERERVRQIFREWMDSAAREHGLNISRRNNSPRGEWLGQTEQERVRIIREWVQMSSQQSDGSSGDNREEQSAEIDTQIERVRDGFVLNQSEGQIEHTRRGIRKLRGRQVMLDMLKKSERERQREIQELLDRQSVSHFPHRNRIQALLRGRFLRNDRCGNIMRSTSIAQSELGLLRLRHSVSGLREGFFSRKDNTDCKQARNNLFDTPSNTDTDFNTNEQTGASSSHMVPTVHSEPNYRGSNGIHISSDRNCLQGVTCENLDTQDSTLHTKDQLQCTQIDSLDSQSSPCVVVKRRVSTGQNVDVNRKGLFSRKYYTDCNQQTNNLSNTLSNSDTDFNTSEPTGASTSHLVPTVHSEHDYRGSDGLHISGDRNCLPGVTFENLDTQDSTLHAKDQLQYMQIDSLDSQPSPCVVVEGRDNTRQNVDVNREGFLSRKDNTDCNQTTNNLPVTLSNADTDFNTIEQTGASSSRLVTTVHSEPNFSGSEGLHIAGDQNCLQGVTLENLDTEVSTLHAEDQLQWMRIDSLDSQPSPCVVVEKRDNTGQNVDVMPTMATFDELTQESLQIEDLENSDLQEFYEAYNEQSELGDIINGENNHMEGNIVDDMNWSESNALQGDQLEEVIGNEGSDWHQSNAYWRNSIEENVDDNQLSSTASEWRENSFGNEDEDNSRLPEAPEVWQEDGGFQEAVENWFGGPSDHESAPVRRIPELYFPDDDNVYSVELRELLSRRSVSNLLHSSFRESLDQLIQSYVERQGNALDELELQETTLSSASVEEELEQQSRDQIVGEEGIVSSPLDLPSLPIPPPLPLWDRHPHRDNWSQNDVNNQGLGMDWEVINDLKLDMARMQQRMNTMQKMLETCIDMQLELQRSIRQEVSAALNRSAGSSGTNDFETQYDESKWECVRKGLCCICCESNIDSLLYRCGHMCTCSNCANDLLESRRKCPMCQAPVVEVIRTYSLL